MNPMTQTPAPTRRFLPATLISLTLIAATPVLADGNPSHRSRERAEKPVARSSKPSKPAEKPQVVAPAPSRPSPRHSGPANVVRVPSPTPPQPAPRLPSVGGWNGRDSGDGGDVDRGRREDWRGNDGHGYGDRGRDERWRDRDHHDNDRGDHRGNWGDQGRGYRGHGRYDRDRGHDHSHRTVYRHRTSYYDPYGHHGRWYRDVWGYDHDPFACNHHHTANFDAFRLFRIPERILASTLGYYRPYFYTRVYYPEHRHHHNVYRFPVWDDGEYFYRPYAYCEDHLFATGWFGDDGPDWDVDLDIHIDF